MNYDNKINYKITNIIKTNEIITGKEVNIGLGIIESMCNTCIWCYDNGMTLEDWCNSDFICENYSMYIDSQVYYLDENREPRRKIDDKLWVEINE